MFFLRGTQNQVKRNVQSDYHFFVCLVENVQTGATNDPGG